MWHHNRARAESQHSGMLSRHRAFKDEAQAESQVKFIISLALPAKPWGSRLMGKWEWHGVTEQRWHLETQGNSLAMLTALWGFTLPWGLSLQENWICTMVRQREKSLLPECASRAVSGELTSSVAENSMTGGQLRTPMGIFQACQAKPTFQLSCNREFRKDSVGFAGELQEFSAKGVHFTCKQKWFCIWQQKALL